MEEKLNSLLDVFENHSLNILTNDPNIQLFECCQAKTWMYGFRVATSSNMISLTGDIGEGLWNPGYGRGLGWLRSSIDSPSYVAGKMVPLKDDRIWNESSAEKSLKEYLNENEIELSDEALESVVFDCDHNFYDTCLSQDIEEPWHIYSGEPRESFYYKHAALKFLCQKLNEMDFRQALGS